MTEPNLQLNTVPICIRPWLHLGLGWDMFGACSNAYKYDFGKIKGYPKNADFHTEVFNSKTYLLFREALGKGELPDVCVNCCGRSNAGNLPQTLKRDLDILAQIEDPGQRIRATDNLNLAINSIFNKEVTVNHKPTYAVIASGSACNIRCKFCYNCTMDYHPEAEDILNVIDQVHEHLIFAQITGGEPLITRAGRALLKEFATGRYKFAVRLGTNAQWTDFDLLKPVNLADVQISTDGATKKVYETVRVGGNFEDLVSNIKKFIELKKEKPFMKVSTNFVVTSDNYMDIPEAVKLYESLGTFTMFHPVMREVDDPQNFKERPELYDDVLKYVEQGISLSQSPFTIEKLEAIKHIIYRKMEEGKGGVEPDLNGRVVVFSMQALPLENAIKEIVLQQSGNSFTAKIILEPDVQGERYTFYFLIKKDGHDYIRSPDSENGEYAFELFDPAEYCLLCAIRNHRGEEHQVYYQNHIIIQGQ